MDPARLLARILRGDASNVQVHGDAKPYQVRQVVSVIRRYDLTLEEDR